MEIGEYHILRSVCTEIKSGKNNKKIKDYSYS